MALLNERNESETNLLSPAKLHALPDNAVFLFSPRAFVKAWPKNLVPSAKYHNGRILSSIQDYGHRGRVSSFNSGIPTTNAHQNFQGRGRLDT